MKARVAMNPVRRAGKNQIQNRNSRKGFTLVELIVVLVILSILAAILVPALIGYIDKARGQQDRLDAENYLTAVQASLTELYAKEGGSKKLGEPIIDGPIDSAEYNMDMDIRNSSFVNKKVIPLADVEKESEPYCLIVGLGSNAKNTNAKTTTHDKYTVLFLMYCKTIDSKAWIFYNGEWSNSYMKKYKKDTRVIEENNVIKGGTLGGKRLQYYTLIYKGTGLYNGTFWDWIRSKQD